mgnify:CR=1 FL=1
MKTLSWRPVVVLITLLVALVLVLPTVQMLSEKKVQPTIWPYKKVNLGLDLQGGMQLVLQVDLDKAVEGTVDRSFDDLRSFLRQNHIRPKELSRIAPTIFAVSLADADKFDQSKGLMAEEFRDFTLTEKDLNGERAVYFALKPGEAENIKRLAFEKAIMKVRNRVDEYGAREPDIRPQGDDRIVVQLPGIIDADRARKEIGRTGHLEFKLVDDEADPREAIKGNLPAGDEIRYYRKDDPEMAGRPIVLKKETLLTGDYLSEARVEFDRSTGRPYVGIKFNTKGSRIFAQITGDNINKRLAIVLDGEVYSAPVIRSKIEGAGIIEGNFNDQSAKALALVLREAFPTPVKILYEKQVGPSLGEDSIRRGLFSMLVGTLLVVVGMVIYYKWAGMIANIALVADLILLVAAMAAFNATLTLPGIAGIILTLGMAVDGNVLIYERIREELRSGKTARAALDAGFERATLTILDANVTTLIAALVLFQFGSGTVKGFAVTLSIGVVVSVFTVLVLCRAIFDYFLSSRQVKRLSV